MFHLTALTQVVSINAALVSKPGTLVLSGDAGLEVLGGRLAGQLTGRLDRLESRDLIRRISNPGDRRSVVIELTEDGIHLVNEAVTRHVRAEQAMLEPLSDRDRATLDRLLSTLIHHLSG